MPDKARNSHIERTVYVSPEVTPGSSLRWCSWRDRPEDTHWIPRAYDRFGPVPGDGYYARGIPLTIIETATGSDYSGSLVEQSNARRLKSDFPWLVELYGGHGTFGLAYLGKRENQNPALIEAIDALASYPIYDDDDHSKLEHEKESEAWESDGRDDFKRALTKYLDAQYAPDEHDLDEISDEQIDALWWDCTERLCGGESYLNEQGDSIYFPIYSVIQKIEQCWPGLDKPHYSGDRPSINIQLVAIATAATIPNR